MKSLNTRQFVKLELITLRIVFFDESSVNSEPLKTRLLLTISGNSMYVLLNRPVDR